MFCLLVSPGPLRRALLLSDDDSDEAPSTASYKVVVDVGPPTAAAAEVVHHVAVDIPDDDEDGDGDDWDVDREETAPAEHISPVRRALVKGVFVFYTAFVAPALVSTAATRSNSGLQALLVAVPAALTVVALFMATLRVFEDEDREKQEEEEGLDGSFVG